MRFMKLDIWTGEDNIYSLDGVSMPSRLNDGDSSGLPDTCDVISSMLEINAELE